MKKLLLISLLLMRVFASDVDDDFGGGDDQFEFERFSNEEVLLTIDQEAAIACNKGLCTLHSMENKFGGFEVNFNVGEGSATPSNGGGVNVFTGGYGNNNNQEFWGFNVKFYKGKCTQTVKVPKSVYYAINRYMYGLMTEEGGTRRGFTPADEAMILFYTTIIDNVTGCTMK